ncbi:hypothetical protein GF342_05515 [Candidatus Woesearchaeota archaeon]|nr:hypothetical protein [Candidatus Woesearchaeota archaeon]
MLNKRGIVLLCVLLSVYAVFAQYTFSSCTDINQSGTWTLNQSFLADSNDCIDIQSSNVTIELNGKIIDGNGSRLYAISMTSAYENITVQNGYLVNYSNALRFDLGSDIVIDNINVSNGRSRGFYFNNPDDVLIRDCSLEPRQGSTFSDGIYGSSGCSNIVIDNTYITGADTGISIACGGTNITNSRIENVRVGFRGNIYPSRIINTVIENASNAEFAMSNGRCPAEITNVTGRGGAPVGFLNYSATISDSFPYSQLVICASDVLVENLTLDGTSENLSRTPITVFGGGSAPRNTNLTLRNLEIRNVHQGMYLEYFNEIFIYDSLFENVDYGLHIDEGDIGVIDNITFNNASRGLLFTWLESDFNVSNLLFNNSIYGLDISNAGTRNNFENLTAYSTSVPFGIAGNRVSVKNLLAFSPSTGLYLRYFQQSNLSNVTIVNATNRAMRIETYVNNTYEDINLSCTSSNCYLVYAEINYFGYCEGGSFENVYESGGKKIKMVSNQSSDGGNEELAQVLFCGPVNATHSNYRVNSTNNYRPFWVGLGDNVTFHNISIDGGREIRIEDTVDSLFDGVDVYHVVGSNSILLRNSDRTTLNDIHIPDGATYGIHLDSSDEVIVNNSAVYLATYGLQASNSQNFTVQSSDFSNHTIGIFAQSVGNIAIWDSNMSHNQYGLQFQSANNAELAGNRFTDNVVGVSLITSGQTNANGLFNNYFKQSTNVEFSGTTYANEWNTTETSATNIVGGPTIAGNWWETGSGFSRDCPDDDEDGICDIAYDVENEGPCTPGVNCSSNTDFAPLTEYYISFTQNNGSEATDLDDYSYTTAQNISNFTLHQDDKVKVRFTENVNLSRANIPDNDLDLHVFLDNGSVSVNTSAVASLQNKTAQITFYQDCSLCNGNSIVYAPGFFTSKSEMVARGQSCGSAGKCSDFSCAANECSFLGTLSGFASGGNANLSINDSSEGSVGQENVNYTFNAFYVNATSGDFITGASCNITFPNGGPFVMNETATHYEYNWSFSSGGVLTWEVTCDHPDYTLLTANDTILIKIPPVPEFSTIALLAALVIVLGGFFVLRANKSSE